MKPPHSHTINSANANWIPTSRLAWSLYKRATLWVAGDGASATETP